MRTPTLVLASLLVAAAPVLADGEVRKPFSASIPRGTLAKVFVDITAGEVEVRNGDAKTISISGELKREYSGAERNQDKQRQILNDIAPTITVSGDTAIVEGKFGSNARTWSAKSFRTEWRILVQVPKGMDVEIGTRYGEITIEGEFGDLEADLRAGEITLRTPRASVKELNASVRVGEVHADLGDERVSNEGILPGTTHFYNATGKSRIKVHTTFGEVKVRLTR